MSGDNAKAHPRTGGDAGTIPITAHCSWNVEASHFGRQSWNLGIGPLL